MSSVSGRGSEGGRPEGGAPKPRKSEGQEGGPPTGGAPTGEGPEGWGPEEGGGPNLEKVGPRSLRPRRCFFPLSPQFSFFLLSLGAFRGILGVFEAPGSPEMCTIGVLGLSCEARETVQKVAKATQTAAKQAP